jgi:hypothetical protein
MLLDRLLSYDVTYVASWLSTKYNIILMVRELHIIIYKVRCY